MTFSAFFVFFYDFSDLMSRRKALGFLFLSFFFPQMRQSVEGIHWIQWEFDKQGPKKKKKKKKVS